MLETTHKAVARGRGPVCLVSRGKLYSIAEVLDALGNALTRAPFATRARRAQRSGVIEPELQNADDLAQCAALRSALPLLDWLSEHIIK